jgi:hypothetical protein
VVVVIVLLIGVGFGITKQVIKRRVEEDARQFIEK